jgi:hypothetical protein
MPSIVGVSQLIGQKGPKGDPGEPGAAGPMGPGLRVLGNLPTAADLPASSDAPGDSYLIEDTTETHTWNGSSWVNMGSIVGPQGPEGPVGPRGAKGDPGDQGAQGPIGLTGPAGLQGPEGPEGPSASGTREGETTGQAVAGLALDDGAGGAVETWLGTTASGGPTDYAITKLEEAGIGSGGSASPQIGSLLYSPDEAQHPTVSKPRTTPILDVADMTAPSSMWPWLVDMRPSGGSGVKLLYSTDHDTGDGGIYVANATSPLGTFTDIGRVYFDTTAGSQTETPSAVWVPEADTYYMYYHNSGAPTGANQTTILATTDDFATFTRVGYITTDHTSTHTPEAHTGYFRPFRVAGAWFAWSSARGGYSNFDAMWHSRDGISWRWEPEPLGTESPLLDHLAGYGPSWRIHWHMCSQIMWRGQPWLIGVARSRYALWIGDNATMQARLITAPLADDLCSLAARPIDITPAIDQAWEGDYFNGIGNVINYDGHLYTPYSTRNTTGAYRSWGLLEVH